MRRGFASGFVNYKKDKLDSQPQLIKFTSCFPVVGGSLQILRIIPQLKHVAPLGHIILIPSQDFFPLAPEIVCLVGISL